MKNRLLHISAETFRDLYWGKKLSLREIAEKFNVVPQSVHSRMRKLGVSLRSYTEANRLIWLNPETRRKQSASHMGVLKTERVERCCLNCGGKFSIPQAWARKGEGRFCSKHCNAQYHMSLDGNPHWQGGKSFETYSREFNGRLKERIRRSADYLCQRCSIRQSVYYRRLDIHHIDHDKKNNSPSNLVALCESCHAKLHRTGV